MGEKEADDTEYRYTHILIRERKKRAKGERYVSVRRKGNAHLLWSHGVHPSPFPCPQDTNPGLTQRRNTNMARALCETVPDPAHGV